MRCRARRIVEGAIHAASVYCEMRGCEIRATEDRLSRTRLAARLVGELFLPSSNVGTGILARASPRTNP
jgi:hypothetical protein